VAEDNGNQYYPVHQSIHALVFKIVLVQILVALTIALIYALLFAVVNIDKSITHLQTLTVVAAIVLQLVDAGLLVYLIFRWLHTVYFISSQEVVIQEGIMQVRRKVYKAEDIPTLEVDQSPLGKWLNYGTITFRTAELGEDEVRLHYVPYPDRYAEVIKQPPQA
jgi:membrane protein YdbS with pleckstrin-like domain